MSWPLALLTLSAIPGILYATHLFRRHVRQSYRRQRAATAKINAFTQEYVSGMSVVQLFNREPRAFRDFSAVNHENKLAWTDAIFAYALYYPVVELLSSAAIALVIWYGGLAVLRNTAFFSHLTGALPAHAPGLFGAVTLGTLIAFIQYAQRFFRPIMDLTDKFNILQAAMAASERVFKLLDTEPEIHSPAQIVAPTPGRCTGSIEFRDVWFTYQRLTPEQTDALVASMRRLHRRDRMESRRCLSPTSSSTPSTGFSAASASPSNPTPPPPSSATPAPARPPSPR